MANTNIDAQEWLNKKYPKNGTCQRKEDKENLNKKRADIITLDIRKGKVGKSGLFSEEKNLIGSLKLEGFTKLRKLIISSHQLTELDVSECFNLTELDCQNNQICVLNVNNCSNLKIINCSNNHVKELDFSACTSLEEVNIKNCLELTLGKIKTDLNYNTISNKLAKIGPRITKAGENDIRNILIIGITGNGKSALANTLSVVNQFEEGSHSTSITKNFKKSDVFEWEKDGRKTKYRVIDNIGFGDTANITEEDILHEIGKGIYSAKEGINQVLFVFKDRFSEEQVIVFNMFKEFIAESEITKVTTLVRTNFPNFRTPQKCEDDKRNLISESNKNLSEIISSCNGLIHIDNPPMPIMEEEDDKETREDKGKQAQINREKRKNSREMILNYLVKDCQVIYKLKEWESIHSMVDNYIKRKEEIKQNLGNTNEGKEEIKKEKAGLFKELRVKLAASLPMIATELKAEIEIIK